jgi:tetratricopeptide (TPR) repeat protein
MDFRKLPIILSILLLTVLIVQPVVSAANQSAANQSAANQSAANIPAADLSAVFSASNGTKVSNITSDNLEKDEATGHFNSAEQLLVKGDYANAIVLYDQALASNTTMLKKTDAILYLYQDKAYAQIQLAKYTDAIATEDAGLALYPYNAMLWNNKGFALSLLGQSQDALAAYDKSVSFDSNYTTAYINQGNVLSQMGRYTEAVAAYTRANETDPFNVAAADGLTAAKKGESTFFMTIIGVIVLIAAAGVIVWYVKFRKPANPAPEEKKVKNKKE